MSANLPDPLAAQIPSAWSAYVPILAGLGRGLLSALGGIGCTWAYTVNASEIQMGVSAALIVVSLIWTAVQKIQALRASHDSSVASANASAQRTATLGVATPIVVETKATP